MTTHIPVMLNEVTSALNLKPDGIYVDATFGRGGHSQAIMSQLNEAGQLHVFDRDPDAIAAAKTWQKTEPRLHIHHRRYGDLQDALPPTLHGKIDGILFDLGVSSHQLDTAERGFSFSRPGPLDMRMNPNDTETAASWLNHANVDDITHALKIYGEERFARPIAKAIVAQRKREPLETTDDLVQAVYTVCHRHQHKHPATRTFQAVRMVVNEELRDLSRALDHVPNLLAPHGRVVILSFHSLEDRLVKQWMKGPSVTKIRKPFPELTTLKTAQNMKTIKVQKKPSQGAIQQNRRARSAILRAAEKINTETP
jgi:16S rRNA (cytosine1402-N4)-methyltransferase